MVRRQALPSLLLLALASGACGDAVIDGLDPNPCIGNPDAGGCPPRVWPNEVSKTNSDAWLRQHHDSLIRIEPQVLVLDFYNGGSTVGGSSHASPTLAPAITPLPSISCGVTAAISSTAQCRLKK